MRVDPDDVVAFLKAQRNAALDDTALLHARVKLLEAEVVALRKKVEELTPPAPVA